MVEYNEYLIMNKRRTSLDFRPSIKFIRVLLVPLGPFVNEWPNRQKRARGEGRKEYEEGERKGKGKEWTGATHRMGNIMV